MRSMWRTTLGLAAVSVAMVSTAFATAGSASATPPAGVVANPPINAVGFATLALTQMLTRGSDGVAVTRYGSESLPQLWDQVYQDQIPVQDGMSTPYLLRSHDTGLCLEDFGDGRPAVAVGCETNPTAGSTQLWQIHRVADRTVAGRNYYFQINRSSGRVLTGQPGAEGMPVLTARPQPVSRSGTADAQLWVMLAAA